MGYPQGYKWLRSSGLNYDPKLHLRHILDPTDLYVKHTSVIINAVLKWILPLHRARLATILCSRNSRIIMSFGAHRDERIVIPTAKYDWQRIASSNLDRPWPFAHSSINVIPR